jgi:hypothetical protein
MGIQVNAKRGSPNEGDRKAEEAAAKVRHTAEKHDDGKSTEQAKRRPIRRSLKRTLNWSGRSTTKDIRGLTPSAQLHLSDVQTPSLTKRGSYPWARNEVMNRL